MNDLAKVFELNPKGFNLRRVLIFLAVLVTPFIVLVGLDQEIYILSTIFGALFVGLSDPGGEYKTRVQGVALVGLFGAVLTLWGFGIGKEAWGWVVVSVLVVTFVGGLTLKFGMHRFLAALLLNIWFLIALALSVSYGPKAHAWSQTIAWLVGSALWIAVTCVFWLIRGQRPTPPLIPEFPGDRTVTKLTRPVILFAVIRAVAVSAGVAIAFGLQLPNADWMPIATVVAMKGSLQQSTLVAAQRLTGALIGAVVAACFLLGVDNKHALEVVVILFGVLGGAIRFVNYAFYTAAIAAAVLIAEDLPNPTNLGSEGRRVLFTLIGVGIAVVVMLLANLMQKRTATTST
jgi:hypothetical protein